MDVRYTKEQQHNYMIIRKTEDDRSIQYHKQMLDTKRLKRLLSTSVRYIDGDEYIYYDITSKLSLQQLYGSRHLDMDEIRSIILDIQQTCEETEQYLLDVHRISLNPEYIYYSYTSRRFFFLYNIANALEEQDDNIAEFLDFLLERVAPEDNVATDYVYKLYELNEKGYFDIWNVLELFPQEIDKEVDKNESCSIDSFRYEIHDTTGISECYSVPEIEGTSVEYMDTADDSGMNATATRENTHRINKSPIILLGGGIIGLVGCVVAHLCLDFSAEEKTILMAVFCMAAFFVVIGVGMLIYSSFRKRKDVLRETNLRQYVSDELGALDYERISGVRMADFAVTSKAINSGRENNRKALPETQEEDDSEHTVFFTPDYENGEYKLYAMDKRNKQHISLAKYPYTIGKMTGYVDCCIDHPSISRLHARIDKRNDRLILSDLNSTNGVFLNGIRLNPNEECGIEIGDEIRLGGLNYCLRYSG